MKRKLSWTAGCLVMSALSTTGAFAAKSVCTNGDLARTLLKIKCTPSRYESCVEAEVTEVKTSAAEATKLQKTCWNVPADKDELVRKLEKIRKDIFKLDRDLLQAEGEGTGKHSSADLVLVERLQKFFNQALIEE